MKKILAVLYVWLAALPAKAWETVPDYKSWDWNRPYYVEDSNPEDDGEYVTYIYNDPERNEKDFEICQLFERFKGYFPNNQGAINSIESCLLMATTAKLTGKQISRILEPDFTEVISYLYPSKALKKYRGNEYYNLEWYIRMYNMVTQNDWPECPYETGRHFAKISDEPCNEDGEILKACHKENMDTVICMQQKLLGKFIRLFRNIYPEEIIKENYEYYNNRAMYYIWSLVGATYSAITAVISEPEEQKKQLLRMYNFYDLMLGQVYQQYLEDAKSPNRS